MSGPEADTDRLEEVRTRLEAVASLPVVERPALFAWVNEVIAAELAAMEQEV